MQIVLVQTVIFWIRLVLDVTEVREFNVISVYVQAIYDEITAGYVGIPKQNPESYWLYTFLESKKNARF